MDYCRGKVNKATDALSQYLQHSVEEEDTLWAENTKILHQLQLLLARVSRLRVLGSALSSLLHKILICETVVLSQLRQFWDFIRGTLNHKSSYTVSIRDMKMRLPKLQDNDKKSKKLRLKK